MFTLAPAAQAAPPGVQRTTYKLGPLNVTPGQNRIGLAPGQRRRNRPVVGKPKVDGWIVRIKPNLTYLDGSIPSSDRVMFHHGVWVNMSGNATSSRPERFFAAGEEKTIMKLPKGFGYRYRASDRWVLNHMIHNLTPQRMRLYVTYTIDFIPDGSAAARGIRPVRPIWMDVENGRGYPVFDSFKGSGKNGRFTYPTDRKNAYPNGDKRNTWTVDRDGVLVSTAGHVHQGGLSTDLWLRRRGASYSGPRCAKRADRGEASPLQGGRAVGARQPGAPVQVDGEVLGAGGPGVVGCEHDGHRAGLAGGTQEGRHARGLHHL